MTMEHLRRRLRRLPRHAGGATAIEYAFVAVGIAVAIALTVFNVGTALDKNFFGRVNTELRDAQK